MISAAFRTELHKIMPGYDWTVHKSSSPNRITATGIQSSGFNRLSTLQVERSTSGDFTVYEVKSAGYGTKAPWARTAMGSTLAQALRELQKHYEHEANHYRRLVTCLQEGRKAPPASNPTA